MNQPIHVVVRVPLTEKEYLRLKDEALSLRSGKVSGVIRRRLNLPEKPFDVKNALPMSEADYRDRS